MIKLALQNLKEQKIPVLLGIFSITIASASIMLLWGIQNGISYSAISEARKNNPENQLIIRQKSEPNKLSSLIPGLSQKKLVNEDLTKISELEGIEKIYPESFFLGIASIEVNALGLNLITDSMIFGLPFEFIKENTSLTAAEWSDTKSPYPVIIPRRILDLYNLTLAPAQGLPTLTEKDLIGKSLTLYPNYSSFFPNLREKRDIIPLKIIGFSDRTNLAGITVSPEVVDKLNQKYFGKSGNQYLEIFIQTKNDPKQVAEEIEALGYTTSYLSKNIEEIQEKLAYLKYSLSVLAIIIILLSGLSIMGSFLARFHDKTREIALYYALGATTRQTKKILLYESVILAGIGSITGAVIATVSGFLLSSFLEKQLQLESVALQIIRITPTIIISTIVLSIFTVILIGLIPMRKVSKSSPATLLH